MIETYADRARRLNLDPTEICIACGNTEVNRVRVSSSRFCRKHVDWEQSIVLRCAECDYEVGLTCGNPA